MKNNITKFLFAIAAGVSLASCAKKLDIAPQNQYTPEQAYSTVDGYKNVLAKLYGTLSIGGNTGPAGAPDLSGGLDEGSQIGFIRPLFNCQELPTDEAVVAWNDQTIQDYHNFSWTSSDPFIKGMYARPIYDVTLINDYLRNATPEKLAARNITGTAADDILNSVAEARFLRAFNYWVMMDLFGNSTFITEEDIPQPGVIPREISRKDLFAYIESELLAIDKDLLPAKTAQYGRVDKAAAWALLARIYLNAEVYTGQAKWSEAITYSKKVIDAGYVVRPNSNYKELFMADNDKQKDEIIWAINCDGLRTKGYGNTTFLINCPAGADALNSFGSVGWSGYRATKGLLNLFNATGTDESVDKRALFTTYIKSKLNPTEDSVLFSPSINTDKVNVDLLSQNDITNFNKGLHVRKFVNKRSDGLPTHDVTNNFADVDFPVFRIPEMYFIYAEAIQRGGTGGDINEAAALITSLRKRSLSTPNPEVYPSDLTLQYLLDERGRELYWECHRRTDLIRYGLFTTGAYLWPMKGGVATGTAVDSKYNLYPVPAEFISSNPNLHQNSGY